MSRTMPPHIRECDLLIVGGGINGAGIARDAAGRGLSVVLCEQDTLAAHTSSASTKLIHGGLRYLEHYEFGLVRKALREREILMRIAPHIIRPLRFVMPHDRGQRPGWLIRLGLFLYDHLARRELLPASATIDLRRHAAGTPLKEMFVRGFAYSDAAADDRRLVELNALDAKEKGAAIFTHTRCTSTERHGNHWLATLNDTRSGVPSFTVKARVLVNATGPWAAGFLHDVAHAGARQSLRLVKGSHIVVRKLFDHPDAYIFQHPDGRIVFAIPYHQNTTLIGTTDVEYHGDPGTVAITDDEIDYLCALVNRYFRQPIGRQDVIASFSGVRPLVNDEAHQRDTASAATRDYRLAVDTKGAPLLTVFGGKLTTYRRLAEEAVDLLAPHMGNRQGHWTATACLPGGDLFGSLPDNRNVLGFEHFLAQMQTQYNGLPKDLVEHYVRRYGSRIHALLTGRHTLQDLGAETAPGMFAAEADYLARHEFGQI